MNPAERLAWKCLENDMGLTIELSWVGDQQGTRITKWKVQGWPSEEIPAFSHEHRKLDKACYLALAELAGMEGL